MIRQLGHHVAAKHRSNSCKQHIDRSNGCMSLLYLCVDEYIHIRNYKIYIHTLHIYDIVYIYINRFHTCSMPISDINVVRGKLAFLNIVLG